jgi:hypothetical protein
MPTMLNWGDPRFGGGTVTGYGRYPWDDMPTSDRSILGDQATPLGESSQVQTQKTAKLTSKLGLFTAVVGGIGSAIGGFYAAKSQQYELESQASNYQFQSDMDALNARSAEADAQSIFEAGSSEIQKYTMRAGQEKASYTAHAAHSGVVLGVGNAKEVAASQDVVKDIDVMTINSNTTREAWAQRIRSTQYRNRSNLERVSANNLNRSARSISPWMSATGSLLGSASRIGTQWLAQQDTRD